MYTSQQHRAAFQDSSHVQTLANRKYSRLIARARARGALKELQELQKRKNLEKEDNTPIVEILEWQSPLEILLYPDPRLRAPNFRIGLFDSTLKELADELFEAMYKEDGVGLAAPQLGVNVRLMVFNPSGVRGEKDFVLVNPYIISSDKKQDVDLEGCLSFLQIGADVKRASSIKVRAQDLSGKRIDLSLSDWQARIFQHEYDHLQGVLFHDRMTPAALAKIKPALIEMEKSFAKKNPGVAIETVG